MNHLSYLTMVKGASALRELGAIYLFEWQAVAAEWKNEHGFTSGHYEFEAISHRSKKCYTLYFKNENMYLCKERKIIVTIPDLICVLESDGKPVINPEVKEGEHYEVIAFPAPEIWRSRRGLELFGPKYLG